MLLLRLMAPAEACSLPGHMHWSCCKFSPLVVPGYLAPYIAIGLCTLLPEQPPSSSLLERRERLAEACGLGGDGADADIQAAGAP